MTDEETARVRALMRRHFGFDALRPGQGEILARALRGESLLAVLPTGGGKSVCYQLPALVDKGVTLVVSPLIALMKDQLDALPAPARAAATAVTSQLAPDAVRRTVHEIGEGRYRLVYAAPERLRQPAFVNALKRAGVSRFVVDEAHCVSVWGHDFRPDYLALADARKRLGNPQTLAFTATAPPEVKADVLKRLGPLEVVQTTVERPNLRLEAVLAGNADEKIAHVVQLAKETKGPGIVYASSQAKCEQIAMALKREGVRANHYHAGVPDRAERQEAFMRGEVDVLVATVAFGMGVDKGNVRFVIHHDPPGSLESYYQEAGRAGRDGDPARCVLVAASTDAASLTQRTRQDQPSEALVREVWDTLARRRSREGYATLEHEELDALGATEGERRRSDTVKPRVALGVLSEAGLVRRLPDVPRVVYVGRAPGDANPLAAFVQKATSALDVARALGVPPQDVEAELLQREDAGDAFVSFEGRDLLLEVAPDAEWTAVKAVLTRYVDRNEARGKHVMRYVKSSACRHAQIRRYFGEENVPDTCGNCDSCLGITHALPEGATQDDEKSRRDVLAAIGEVGRIGEANIAYMLRGDTKASPWTHDKVAFGALAHRSQSAVRRLVAELLDAGYVERETLDHGGTVVRLTRKGQHAVQTLAPIELPKSTSAPRAVAPRRAAATPADTELDGDALARFEALREWRWKLAQEGGVPPYVVFPDKTLKALAVANPSSKDALLGIKGVGPKKLEMFGDDVLAVLNASTG